MNSYWGRAFPALVIATANGFTAPQNFPPHPLHRARINARSEGGSLSALVSSNEDLKPGIAAIDGANEQLMQQLNELRQVQNFRLYSVDILASCEYMPQELFECYSETCEIYPVDEDEVSCRDGSKIDAFAFESSHIKNADTPQFLGPRYHQEDRLC